MKQTRHTFTLLAGMRLFSQMVACPLISPDVGNVPEEHHCICNVK